MMEGLTLWEPYATVVALGIKTEETRGWAPPAEKLERRIAIHAGKTAVALTDEQKQWLYDNRGHFGIPEWGGLPTMHAGCIVATAKLAWFGKVTDLFPDTWHDGEPLALVEQPYERGGFTVGVDLWGDFSVGRWIWGLENVVRLGSPVACNGRQKLWRLASATETIVRIREEEARHGS